MNPINATAAAKDFLLSFNNQHAIEEITPLSGGLINHTYKVKAAEGNSILLQRFNTDVFKSPQAIQGNYRKIVNFAKDNKLSIRLPEPIPASDGSLLFIDEESGYWRAFGFIENTVSFLTAILPEQAFTTAKTFGKFAASLNDFPASELQTTIPDFHNLSFRYRQFLQSIETAGPDRKQIAAPWIEALLERSHYNDFYASMLASPEDFKLRVMHHDAKIANMLFDAVSREVVCVVDFDTTMPGYYFSDLGDMIRSMACSHDENHVQFEDLSIREDFYQALVDGYLEEMAAVLTEVEKQNIHQCGLLMYYMQALRFLAEYLNNDIYYRIGYPEQNLHRAINQITLLKQLETLLKSRS